MQLFVKINILLLTLIFVDVRLQEREVLAVYGFTSHLNMDGTPSKDDSRYKDHNLYLYDDYSFVYLLKKGKISTSYVKTIGTWKIRSGKLVVSVKERHYTDFINKVVKEKHIKRAEFKCENNKLIELSENREWERRQGIGVQELFEK